MRCYCWIKRPNLFESRSFLLVILLLAVTMNAFGFMGVGETRWKEEVLLHDGNMIVVSRWQSYGGRYELDQTPPIKEHRITFSLPGSNKNITWTSEYGEDIGRTNFNPIGLHIMNRTPYVVAVPNLCVSYGKWGRPNPPYVFFRYDGTAWLRISLQDVPAEFTTVNLVINTVGHRKELNHLEIASAKQVKKMNSSLKQPEYQSILRLPVTGGEGLASCPDYNAQQYRSSKAPLPMKSVNEQKKAP